MSRLAAEAYGELEAAIQSNPSILLGLNCEFVRPGALLEGQTRGTAAQFPSHDRCQIVVFSHLACDEIQRQLGRSDIYFAGNNGLEVLGPGIHFHDPLAEENRGRLAQLAKDLKSRLAEFSAAAVENHGFIVRVRFDEVAQVAHDEIRRRVHTLLANSNHPFMIATDRLAHDIRPRTSWTKASSLLYIRQQLNLAGQQIVFFGGASDEDSFAMLDGHITIRVGEWTETRARFTLNNADVALEILQRLAGHISVRP